jgi:pimeloyl-ACP methyl ester carboxylesterase
VPIACGADELACSLQPRHGDEVTGLEARAWKRSLCRGLGVAVLVTVVVGIAIQPISRRYLFPASKLTPATCPSDFVETWLTARDGVRVRMIELVAPGARTVVHFHNNRDTIEGQAEFARALHARGLGVLLVEYRGYGHSRTAGAPSEEGLYLDAEAALDRLGERGLGPERIVLSGVSLGTGVAAEMARRGRGSRLLLVTPYTSIPDLVTNTVPFVPARSLLGDRFETLSKAPSIRIPTLVVHGDADEIVPFAMGETLARALANGRLLRVTGGHHGDLFAREGARLFAAIAELAAGP